MQEWTQRSPMSGTICSCKLCVANFVLLLILFLPQSHEDSVLYQPKKVSPAFSSSIFSIGIAVLPMPCSFKMSLSEYFESCFNVLMLTFSNARCAGAASNAKKPSFGFLASSQIGQVGQSLLL